MNASAARLRTATFLTALLLGGAAAAQAAPHAAPSMDERIHCQEALERVYWSHRSPSQEASFAQAVPRTVVRRRAEDAVLQTAALQRFWSVTVTPQQLQAELDRMAAQSQSPARLRELLAALDNDPGKAAECLARPLLVDRLVRTHYAHDPRLHADARARAQREQSAIGLPATQEPMTGVRTEVEWRRGHDGPRSPGALELEPDEFDARVRDLRTALGGASGEIVPGRPSPVREDETRFYVSVVRELDDRHVALATIEWPKRPFEEWWNETRGNLTPAPVDTAFAFRLPAVAAAGCADDTWKPTLQLLDPRYWHTAVWTGSEMIVYGGMSSVGTTYGDGSRYDPATDTWKLLPTIGSPGQRQSHVAVWTGTEMVVWGGRGDTSGGRYDPSTNSWTPTSTANAPATRWNASVVWTGTEMLVWGGDSGLSFVLNSGGRYHPATDTWTPMAPAPLAPRAYHTAVWTGSQMIVWGPDSTATSRTSTGTARATAPPPTRGRQGHRHRRCQRALLPPAVWTGTEMIVWGGLNFPSYDLSGGRYDPLLDHWTPTSLVNPPQLRWLHVAVWTGSEMIVEGGESGVLGGGRYDPALDTWAPTSSVSSANNGEGTTAVWTGSG